MAQAPPESTKTSLRQRLTRHAEQRFALNCPLWLLLA
jgi:hypothetical protein